MKQLLKSLSIAGIAAVVSLSTAHASFSDSFAIPGPDAAGRAGAIMPYTRYDSPQATLAGGATLRVCTLLDAMDIASQASDGSYISLPTAGSSAEWTVDTPGDGVTLRFTMPDNDAGTGLNGSLDVLVNGTKALTVDLTSYYMYQYFQYYSGTPSDTPNGQIPSFAFDEVHFILPTPLKAGDRIQLRNTRGDMVYGVDFIELETVPAAIGKPEGAISVTDFGAVADDGVDDYAAFSAAMAAAARQKKTLYIPAGTFHLSQMWHVYGRGITVTGAGMWHTNIKFTSPARGGGGISGGSGADVCDCVNLEICHMYINSSLRSRYNEDAIYKCFMDVFTGGTVIHDVWEDHFECGFWIADYHGSLEYSDNLKIINCRIRNNLADGVNFCQGTSNAAVYNCSIRNCGDDGLAMWNNSHMGSKDEEGNIFAYNTIELVWRAGGIAIYGGNAHRTYNNYLRDMFMASGIHLNSTFPGHAFTNCAGIEFANNTIVASGTDRDCWNEDLAAIDIKGNVRNISFSNTRIYNSPAYAIRILSDPTGISFHNTTILGSGMAGGTIEYSCVCHSACAIRLQNLNTVFTGDVNIGGVSPDKVGNNSTWPIWTDNNRQLAQSVGYTTVSSDYTVPSLPAAGTIDTGCIHNDGDDDDDPNFGGGDDTPRGYDLIVSDISYSPYPAAIGQPVTFKALVKNAGDTAIPAGTVIGVQFQVDGSTAVITWCDSYDSGLDSGADAWLEANGGTNGNTWVMLPGYHTVTAWVDDVNRLPDEADENNNMLTLPFNFTDITGIATLTVDLPADTPVYNLTGQLVATRPLPSGIYITARHKFLVK